MYKKLVAVMILVQVCSLGLVLAEEEVSIDLTADFYGKYIWRGQNLTDEPVFQPGVSASYKGFTVGAWGSMDLTDENDESGDFTEWDFYGGYAFDLTEGISAEVGAINYHFPSAYPDTTEIYWALGFDELPLCPSVTVYHDIDAANGTYVSFGVGHTVERLVDVGEGCQMDLELGAGLGWGSSGYNEFYWGVDDSKLNDLQLTAALPISMNGWTVSPSVNYSMVVSDELRESPNYGSKSDNLYWGVSLSTSF